MYSSNKKITQIQLFACDFYLLFFVGAKVNRDVSGSTRSADADSYCTSLSVEQIKSKELGCVLI